MTKTVNVFVVEDEIIHQEAIKMALSKIGYSLLGLSDNADEAFDQIKKHKPDVVLVDIALPGINNGITLAKHVHDKLQVPVIFTTSFTEESIIQQAAQASPSGYLTKPVQHHNLKAAILLALSAAGTADGQTPTQKPPITVIKIGDKLIRVETDNIVLVKADGDNCIAVVTTKKEFICRTTLKAFCKDLPPNFIQTHRSYYINLNYLDSFNEREQTAVIKNHTAPVARNFRVSFFQHIKKW